MLKLRQTSFKENGGKRRTFDRAVEVNTFYDSTKLFLHGQLHSQLGLLVHLLFNATYFKVGKEAELFFNAGIFH